MARVLLINPPLIDKQGRHIDGYQGSRPKLPVLGIAYIASVLIQAGHQVKIIEGMAEYVPLEEILSFASSFDIVGITSNTFHALLSHQVARAIKEQNKNIPVVMGGPHASVVPEEVLADKNIDFVVIGEGEYTFLELVETLVSKGNFETVKGIAFRKDNKIIFSGERACQDDLDEIPLPSRDLLPMHLYHSSAVRSRRNPALHMISSRGCFHNCSFCCNKSIYRCRLRMHSSVRVVEEMKVLVKDFGAKEIHFWDDCFVYDEERVYKICQMLRKEGLSIPWDCEATIDRVNLGLLKEMRSSGCFGVAYGIETGNEERFKKLNKGWLSKDKIRQAVAWARQAKLRVRGYFMLGFVGEKLKEMEQTIQFAKELDLDYATFSLLVPLPGTDDYEKAKKEGNFDAYYWRSKIVSEMAFPLDAVYTPEGVSKEQLLMIQRKACRIFYFRPKIIFRHIMGLGAMDGLLYSLKTGYNIITPTRIRNYDN